MGDTRWLSLPPRTAHGPLDYDAAFLQKAIVPGAFVNDAPVARYRAYIERNNLQGMVTLGARLWDVTEQTAIDRDYARAFLPADVDPGATAETTIRMRAPHTPGLYCVTFDVVDEYLTWFRSVGSPVAVEYIRVEGDGVPPDSRAPEQIHATIELVDQPRPGVLIVALSNTGATVWLKGPLPRGGFVQLGVQRLDAAGVLVDRDFMRFPLTRTVLPGETIRMRVDVAGRTAEDVAAVRLDLVSELCCWFSDLGTEPLTVGLRRRR